MKANIIILSLLIFVVGFFYVLPEPTANTSDLLQKEDQIFDQNFIIRNGKLYDGDQLYEKADIKIINGLVAQISKQLPVQSKLDELDGSGQSLIPGLVDAHTHVFEDALTEALKFGVTTELDMFSMPSENLQHHNNRKSHQNYDEADLFSSTILATAPKGHGTEYGLVIPVLESVEEVNTFVEDRITEGADYIKAVYNSPQANQQHFPSISLEILQALVNAAHGQDKMLVVHVDNLLSAKEVIAAGADGIVHSFLDEVVDDEFVDMMKAKQAFMVPTLSVEASLVGLGNAELLMQKSHVRPYINTKQKQQMKASFPDFNIPADGLRKALKSVKRLADAGVTILAGTDAPNPGTAHGISLHGEMLWLKQAGLSPEQVIHSATGAARSHFDIGSRGTLKIGARASMFLIAGDVFKDIAFSTEIVRIWKNGQQVKRTLAELQSSHIQLTPQLITDFNDALNKTQIYEGVIVATSDQYAAGQSEVTVELKQFDSENSYLSVHGEIKKGAMFPWAGISYMTRGDQKNGVDISQIQSLTFKAKSSNSKQVLSVMMFQKGVFMPSVNKVQINDEWQMYELNLQSFVNVDLNDIVNISIVATEPYAPFDFAIDDLKFE